MKSATRKSGKRPLHSSTCYPSYLAQGEIISITPRTRSLQLVIERERDFRYLSHCCCFLKEQGWGWGDGGWVGG